ncbi:MAG TPA: hypothetical protein VGF79_02280 [Bacteroidia bacterium]
MSSCERFRDEKGGFRNENEAFRKNILRFIKYDVLLQMMFKTIHVKALIEALAQKTGQPMDHAGFGQMSESIDGKINISQKYLGDVYREVNKKIANGTFNTRNSRPHLNAIAQFLDYKHFDHFSATQDFNLSPVMHACLGNWWSYALSNNGQYIYQAPVKIYMSESPVDLLMELKGSERSFKGSLREDGTCLSGFLDSSKGKKLGLVFRLSNSLKIELLQGVFCGMSSAGEPIAGKELLVREKELTFREMKWAKLKPNDESLHENIRRHFSIKESSVIKVQNIVLNIEDLV